MTEYETKFKNFIRMLSEYDPQKIDVILVTDKQVLGDNQSEYSESVRRIKEAGAKVLITRTGELIE